MTPRFYEDLAILSTPPRLTVLACRGISCKAGDPIEIHPDDKLFFEDVFDGSRSVALQTDKGILLLLGDLYPHTETLIGIAPHGDPASVAYALQRLSHPHLLLSPSLSEIASHTEEAEKIHQHLTKTLELCFEILHPSEDSDFRLLCARIASLAGCRINVTDLPVGHYPILAEDLHRWTVFLLCTLLALRGDSAKGASLELERANRPEFRIQLRQQSDYQPQKPVSLKHVPFPKLPAFSDFQLLSVKGGLIAQARLRRTRHELSLSAAFSDVFADWICLEIYFS